MVEHNLRPRLLNPHAPPDVPARPLPRGQRIDMQDVWDDRALTKQIKELELLNPPTALVLRTRINLLPKPLGKEREETFSVGTTLYGAGLLSAAFLWAMRLPALQLPGRVSSMRAPSMCELPTNPVVNGRQRDKPTILVHV